MPFQPLASKSLPSSVNQHLKHTQELLNDILNKDTPSVQPSQDRYYQTPNYYHSPYRDMWLIRSMLPNPSPTNHFHLGESTASKSQKKGQKEKDNLLLGIALAAVTTALVYIFGKEVGTHNNAVADIDRLNADRKIILKQVERGNYSKDTRYQIQDIMDLEQEILETYKASSDVYLRVKGTTLSGSVLALYGVAVASSACITGGAFLAFAGALGWAYNSGVDTTDKTVDSKARTLLMEMNSLKSYYR